MIRDDDGELADFMASANPTVAEAGRAMTDAQAILEATPASDVDDETYRAAERAISRARNSGTAAFVQETLRTVFGWTGPTATPGP